MSGSNPDTGTPHKLIHRGAAIGLPEGLLVVGRGASCFLQLQDDRLSRAHFRLLVDSGVQLEDLDSANGTYVNGAEVQGVVLLEDGDEIRAGDSALIYCDQDHAFEEEDTTEVGDRRPSAHDNLAIAAALPGGRLTAEGRDAPPKTLRGVGTVPSPAENDHDVASQPEPEVERAPAAGTDSPPHAARTTPAVAAAAAPLRVRYRSAARELDGDVLHLARGRIFLRCDDVDSAGTSCEVALLPAGADPIAVNGLVTQVVHRGNKGMGIDFVDVADEVRERIAALAGQHTPKVGG